MYRLGKSQKKASSLEASYNLRIYQLSKWSVNIKRFSQNQTDKGRSLDNTIKRKFTDQFIFCPNTFRQQSLSRSLNVTWWSHCCNSSISFSKWMTPSTCTNLILRIGRSTKHTTTVTCYLMDTWIFDNHCHGDCRSHNLLDQLYNSDQFYSIHRTHSNVWISRVYSAVIGKRNTSIKSTWWFSHYYRILICHLQSTLYWPLRTKWSPRR